MKISYVTAYDSKDIRNWSGTGAFIAKSLELQNYDLEYIGNLEYKTNLLIKLKSLYYSRILHKDYFQERSFFVANHYAKQVKKEVNSSSDLIFSPGTIPIAYLETKKPKVFYTDATFSGMINFYDSFSNLCEESIKDGNMLEQQAMDSSDLCIFSSDWAAKSAIENYKVDPEKIKIVPFGANIECNRKLFTVKEIVNNRDTRKCVLLFIGVEWVRKGGYLAIEVAKKLNELGLPTELNIVGLDLIPVKNPPQYICNHGFISKKDQVGETKITELISKSHFLILPSLSDCTPIVLCEANSFGVPCLTTDVGGIPTIIKNNLNGHTFSQKTFVEECCSFVLSMFEDYSNYKLLTYSSFNEYDTRLNWNVTGKKLITLMKTL